MSSSTMGCVAQASRTQIRLNVVRWLTLALSLLTALSDVHPASAQTRAARFLAKEDIILYGIGLKVEPAQQTVPKDIATIVSTYMQAPTLPDGLPAFAPDAEIRATLAGPTFSVPRELVVRPNSAFNIPPLTVPGVHMLENIRLVSGGEVLLYGSPQSVRIEVIERLLVTQVTARPLSAAEIREKGIVFDRSNFQAYNFSAAFAVEGTKINLNFPVLLPTLQSAADDQQDARVVLQSIGEAQLPSLQMIIPDTLRIQTQVPNLAVVGFTLKAPELKGQHLIVPPIPGVIVIPGDIGFLNQFFSVMLMVGNVAPAGSNLFVDEVRAEIVLPPGRDGVVGTGDDPLRMASTASGESARVQIVVQPGLDAKLGSGDDIATIGPGTTANAEYLVEGRREGSHVVEMQISATLHGLPVGPVPVSGRAAGAVLVRNPAFTLTFTHPQVVSAGEAYNLDVTVTNTSVSPANFVSVNLYPGNVSGAAIVGEGTRQVETIPAGDSATVSFDLVSRITGAVTAATLDSDENVAGRFALKTAVGELGVPLSPDSLVLPKEASGLPKALRDAAIALLGKAWAVATAPTAALPKDLSRFSKKIVLDRAVEVAEAGLRVSMREPLSDSAAQLVMEFAGSNYRRLEQLVKPADLAFEQANVRGFDELRRKSVRGDVFAAAIADALSDTLAAQGAFAFHARLAEHWSYRPGHVSILTSAVGGLAPYDMVVMDSSGRPLGGTTNGKVTKDIPFADLVRFTGTVSADLAILAAPETGPLTVRLVRRTSIPDGPVTMSIVVPTATGGLRQVVYQLSPGQVPAPISDAAYEINFEVNGATAVTSPSSSGPVNDSGPMVISVIQQKDADLVVIEPGKEWFRAGRVVAVLFSEEVTAASVQDRLASHDITNYEPEGNRVVGVALQPGGRIAFLALRDPIGPFVPRALTISGVTDGAGHSMAPWTGPMETTVNDDGAVVTGRVLDATGTPIAFANVRLFYVPKMPEFGGQPVWEGISSKNADESGRYSWDYVAKPMVNRIMAVDPQTDDARNVQYNVQRQGQRLNVDIVFLGRGAVRGVIRSEAGVPLRNTAVRIKSLTDYSEYGATTGDDGRYEIARVPVGNIFIEAVNAAARARFAQADVIPFAGAVVDRDLTLLDVEQTKITVKHGTVRGRVYREDGVTVAGGVPVIAYYQTASQPGVLCPPSLDPCPIASTTASADGGYEFIDVTAGRLTIRSFDQAGLSTAEVGLVLPSDGVATANLLLSGGLGTVQGQVLDADGKPVAGAHVGGGLTLTTSNAQGEFTLADVPTGRREIVAVSQLQGSIGRATIDILRSGDIVAVTVVLEKRGAIAGRVFKADGAPVPDVTVYAFRPGKSGPLEPIGSAVTDGTGAYRIEHVSPGPYKVSAFSVGFVDGNISDGALTFNGQTARTDIRFRGGAGKVTGVVYDSDGQTPLKARVGISGDRVRVAGGLVAIGFERVENFKIVDTDLASGRFTFNGLLVGPFTLSASGSFSPDPISVEATIPAPDATVEMNLRLQATSQIRGTVTQPDGATPAGADVIVRYKSEAYKLVCTEGASGETRCVSFPQGIQEETVVTDAAGRFWLSLVNAGMFTLTVEDPATGRVAQLRGSVRPGEVAEAPVRLLAQGTLQVQVFGGDTTTAIPGGRVIVKQLGFPKMHRQQIADTGGRATFAGGDGLTEGEFVVEVMDMRNGFTGRGSGRIEPDGEQVVLKVYLFNASGSVHGVVYDSDGLTLVQNADVVVTNTQGPLAFAVTASDGTYGLGGIPIGDVSVEIFDAKSGRRGTGSARIDLNGQDVPVNVVLSAMGLVKGVVLENGERTPLKGWSVALLQRSPDGVTRPMLTTTTGVDGRFSIPGAARGSFTLHAQKAGVNAIGQASGELDREGQVVDVPMLITIARPLSGSIIGTVLTSTGAPAANSVVEICANCNPAAPVVLTADENGTFSLANVPLGRFTARARSQVSPDAGSAVSELRTDGEVVSVVIAMEGVARVTGTVERSDGTPVAGAQVAFEGFPSSACGVTACVGGTDQSGRFSFIDQPARSFTVTATDPISGLKGTAGGPLAPGESKAVRIVLAPTAALSGRVLTASGQPAGGIVAELIVGEKTLTERRLYKPTGPDGVFRFNAAPLELFRLVLTDAVGAGIASRTGQLTGALSLGDIVLDEAAPAVATMTPQTSSIGVALSQPITIVFTEPIQPGTVIADNVGLSTASGVVVATLDVTANDTSVTLTPLSALSAETRYTLRVRGIRDRVGRVMAADFTAAFTTVDVVAPVLVEASPAANTGGATIHTPVRLRFSEPIDPARFVAPPITLSGPAGAIAGRLDYLTGNTVIVFTPKVPLAENTVYHVQVAAAADIAGNRQSSGSSYQFSTTDRTPPQIVALTAANAGLVIENGFTTVSADIGATHDVLFIDFYLNGKLAFVDRASPFAMDFQATAELGAPGSTIDVSAVATDTSGNRGVAPASTFVRVTADQPPAVTITSPGVNVSAKNGDRVVVTVRATDDLGVKDIGYRAVTGNPADAITRQIAPLARERTETFAFHVPADAQPGSVIAVQASAADTRGQVTVAVPVQVTVVDAVLPIVTITGATTGAQITPGQQTTIIVTATDQGGITSIAFAASGILTANEARPVASQKSAVTSFSVTVPTTAQSGQTLLLDATAIDRAGNTGVAARVILPVGDSKPPTLTLLPENGLATAIPGRVVRVIAAATDDIGIVRVNLSTTGAVTFSDAKQVSPPLNSAAPVFEIPIPASAVPGSIVEVRATATDISNNTSVPATLSLVVVSHLLVTLPASQIVDAGDSLDVDVQLGEPAPAEGLTLAFASSNRDVVTVPPAVSFAAGETTQRLTLNGVAGGTAQIRALIGGVERATMTVTVAGGIVRGIARDSMLLPVGGANVTVSSGATQFATTTDGAGVYRVSGVDGPHVAVRVTDPATKLYGHSTGNMAHARGVVVLNVVLIPAGAIAGRVLDADGVTPAGASVKVEIFGSHGTPIATTFTGDGGLFEFPLVTLGNYSLDASSGTHRGRATVSLSQSGQQLETTIVYLGAGTITGSVRSGGLPVANARLRLEAWSIFGQSTPIVANAQIDGTFSFTGVPVGGFTLTAEDTATNQKGSVTGAITLHGQSVTASVNLASYGAVIGTVYRADGSTIAAGASVTMSGGNNSYRQTFTGVDGSYRFDVVPFGSYLITATDASTRARGIASVVVDSHQGTERADVTFQPQGRLFVTVTHASGQPVVSAFVRVSPNTGSITDEQTATTGIDGSILIDHVPAGKFTARASFGPLQGVATGLLAAGELKNVSILLEPTGSITGTVYAPGGQTPVADAQVRLNNSTTATTNADGVYRIDGLRMGRYTVSVYDKTNRLRARTKPQDPLDDVVLSGNGEVVTRDFTMIGLGTVVGRVVLSSNGQSAANAWVEVRAHAPGFALTRGASTDGGGFYRVEHVPVGPVTATVSDPARLLFGESGGVIAQHDAEVQIDVSLTSNAITMPRTIFDANGRLFDIQTGGQLNTGAGVFGGALYGPNFAAFWLDISSGGVSTRFTGGEVPTIEDANREIVLRQENVYGLSVTRKVFVPRSGYFARYLEILRNPTGAPVTVDLRVTSHVNQDSDDVRRTDRWLALPPGVAFVADGSGASMQAAELSTTKLALPQFLGSPIVRKVVYGWNTVTVGPGETVALMHFAVQQLTTDAAVASAERLSELPPEALAGLGTDELTTVRNWNTPADGQSILAPLPALTGTIAGRTLDADGVTTVPFAAVRFQSTHPLFPKTHEVISDGNGSFTFISRFADGFNSATLAVPVFGFTLTATHPSTQVVSPVIAGAISPQTNAAVRDVVFANTGGLFGTVRRHNGAGVTAGSVTIAGGAPATSRAYAIAADATYRASGLPAGAYTVLATVAGVPGTGINGVATADVPVGPATRADITIEPTGSLAGVVRRASGLPASNVAVRVERPDFTRQVQSDSGGSYTFGDMPLGTFTLSATEPATNIRSTAQVSIVTDQVTTQDLTLVATGRVVGVVRLNGVPQAGIGVSLRSAHPFAVGLSGITDPGGAYVFNAVPSGAFTLTVRDTSRQLFGDASGRIDADGQEVAADVDLLNNVINLPVSRFDASNFEFHIRPGGEHNYGPKIIFLGSGSRTALLEVETVDGATLFTGAAIGTHEDGAREVAMRQSDVAGLEIERKVFVPRDGYFARYLELLSNPSSEPVTVTVRVRSAVGAVFVGSCSPSCIEPLSVISTSSGDNVFDISAAEGKDRWLTLARHTLDSVTSSTVAPPLAFVFNGMDAEVSATAGSFVPGTSGVLAYEWQNITVLPGSSAAFMHFIVQQTSQEGAKASAERLEQLPPEALTGLSAAEIGAIRNFDVPPTGTSTLEPLPSLVGTVTGRALASDGATIVGEATVSFKSANPLFGRNHSRKADASTGAFALSGVFDDQGSSVAIPLGPFTLSATHPSTAATTMAEATFAEGASAATHDVVFAGTANMSVVVTAANGVPLAGANVRLEPSGTTLSIGVEGRGTFTGLAPGDTSVLTFRRPVSPQAGSDIQVRVPIDLRADQTTAVTLVYPAIGQLTGALRLGSGAAVPNRTVKITSVTAAFFRSVSTNASGQFTLTDLPAGSYRLTATHPQNGAPVDEPVTVVDGQTTTHDLTLPSSGSVSITVRFSRDEVASNSRVVIRHIGSSGSFLFVGTSNAAGQVIATVPAGEFTVRADHPRHGGLASEVTGVMSGDGQAMSIAVTLRAIATVQVQVRRASGAGWSGLRIDARDAVEPFYLFYGYTNANGDLNVELVAEGPFTIRVSDRTTGLLFAEQAGTILPSDDNLTVPFRVVITGSVGTVEGRVLAADGATPVADAQVVLYSAAGAEIMTAFTDVDGRYEFADVQPGTSFTVRASTRFNPALVVERPGVIAPGGTVAVDLTLPVVAGTISGVVRAADGITPVAGAAIVALENVTGATEVLLAYTDDTGRYELPNIAFGSGFTLRAEMSGMSQSHDAAFAAQGETRTIDFVLPIFAGSINGHVYAGDGQTPLPGAVVEALAPNGAFIGSATTDETGRYEMLGLWGPARFTVTAFHEFAMSSVTHQVDFTVQNQVVTADLVMPIAVVKGRVTNFVWRPEVFVESLEFQARWAQTDSDGNYVVMAALGPIRVTAHDSESGVTKTVAATVADVATAIVVDIALPTTGTVEAVVSDIALSLAGEYVYLRSDSLHYERWAIIDDAGKATFAGVPEGYVSLKLEFFDAASERYVTLIGSGVVLTEQTVTITIAPIPTGRVSGRVHNSGTSEVQAEVQIVSVYGEFTFWQSVFTDGSGAFAFDGVPAGSIYLTATDSLLRGKADGVLNAGATLELDITLGNAVSLEHALGGADGWRFDIQSGGTIGIGGTDPLREPFVSGGYSWSHSLRVNGTEICCPSDAGLEENGQQLRVGGDFIHDGLVVSRSIFVPSSGGFARYLEVLHNPRPVPQTITMQVNIGLQSSQTVLWPVMASSTGRRFAVSTFGAEAGVAQPTIAYVIAGAGTPQVPTLAFGEDLTLGGFAYQYTISIAAYETVGVLHFTLQRDPGDTAGAQAAAEALVSLTNPDALLGLTAREKAMIVNFNIPK